jgi:hypothetical protein
MYTNPIRVSCHYTAASKCAVKRSQLQSPSLSRGLPVKNVQYHPGTNLDSLKFTDEIFCWRCYSFGNMGSLKIHISPGLGNKLLTLRSKSEWNSKDRARHPSCIPEQNWRLTILKNCHSLVSNTWGFYTRQAAEGKKKNYYYCLHRGLRIWKLHTARFQQSWTPSLETPTDMEHH